MNPYRAVSTRVDVVAIAPVAPVVFVSTARSLGVDSKIALAVVSVVVGGFVVGLVLTTIATWL